MSLGKRHIGRRVAGVGVAVGLMMLGLAAPASAAATVTAVAPTSGPADCVVTITGTGFTDFTEAQQSLDFVGPITGTGDDINVADADWFANSATEILAVVPAVVAGTSYSVVLTDPTGGTSTGTFLGVDGTLGAGGCAPTITSFTPLCASAGATVVITGTNLLDAGLDGATVGFNPYTPTGAGQPGNATHTVPDVDTTTSLSVLVPTGTADGRILVTTDVDTDPNTSGTQGAFSATNFLTPPPDCLPVVPTAHARSISFKIKSTGKASGKVSSTEDPAFTDCVAAVPVKIQKKTSSGWKTVGKTTTTDTGSYAKKVKNPKGKQKFRALAPKVSLGDPVTDTCTKAKSVTRKV
jgi:hypothetical protein